MYVTYIYPSQWWIHSKTILWIVAMPCLYRDYFSKINSVIKITKHHFMPLIDYPAKEACYLIIHLPSYWWNGVIRHKWIKWHCPADVELCVTCTWLCVHVVCVCVWCVCVCGVCACVVCVCVCTCVYMSMCPWRLCMHWMHLLFDVVYSWRC